MKFRTAFGRAHGDRSPQIRVACGSGAAGSQTRPRLACACDRGHRDSPLPVSACAIGRSGKQADLAAEKVKALRGETLPTPKVEAVWTSKLRAFRNRVLAIPSRVNYLSLRGESLKQELRAALRASKKGTVLEARACTGAPQPENLLD
jgi:hypothetical protein